MHDVDVNYLISLGSRFLAINECSSHARFEFLSFSVPFNFPLAKV